MNVLRTKLCSSYGHPEFRIIYDPTIVSVPDDINWFSDWLEDTVAQGIRYSAGQTCQVGWSVTTIRLRDDGDRAVWEPDMNNMPFVWLESVSYTLAHLRLQKDVVGSVLDDEDMSFPSMCESTIICNRLGAAKDLLMERFEPAGTDSGWFCGCQEDDHDHNDPAELRCVSLYEAAVRHDSRIVPFLALPSGTLVSAGEGVPSLYSAGELLAFRPGSFLARLHLGS
jgi:hypothetical protein